MERFAYRYASLESMKITARIKPNSKVEKVEVTGDKELRLAIKAPAKEGKANAAAIKLLSEYFGVPKSRISIIKGHASKNKVISIDK